MRISGSRWLLTGTAAVVLLVGALVVGAALDDDVPSPSPADAPAAVIAPEARTVSVARAVSSLAVLRDWDRSRAAAWASGDPAALGRLYVEDSRAGASDVAMLRAWRERGLRVEGMSMQVLKVELRQRTERRLVLVVTDRLVGAEAVGSRDGCCATSSTSGVALPRDQMTTRTLVFRRVEGRWLLASAQESPVASTAATSGSSN